MISAEDFQKMVADEEAGLPCAFPISEILNTIKALDLQLVIAQNALELCLTNLVASIPALAEKVLAIAGRTDKKIKKKVAELAAGIVGECEDSLQTYMMKANLEAIKLLGVDLETTEVAPVVEEEDDFVPNNID